MLCDISASEDKLASKGHSWTAVSHYVPEDKEFESDLEYQEDDECDLLSSRLSRFIPHTLETIEEGDGEYAYAQGRKPALERQSVHIQFQVAIGGI
jgi:hypothetical protein